MESGGGGRYEGDGGGEGKSEGAVEFYWDRVKSEENGERMYGEVGD